MDGVNSAHSNSNKQAASLVDPGKNNSIVDMSRQSGKSKNSNSLKRKRNGGKNSHGRNDDMETMKEKIVTGEPSAVNNESCCSRNCLIF